MLKTLALAGAALLLVGSAAAAQSARELDPAGNARTNATGGRSNSGTVNGPASRGAGTGENKPSATGGEPGGGTNQQ